MFGAVYKCSDLLTYLFIASWFLYFRYCVAKQVLGSSLSMLHRELSFRFCCVSPLFFASFTLGPSISAPLTRFYELRRYISFYLYLYCTVRRPCTSYLLITNNRINVHITLSSEQDVCLNTKYTDNAHRCIKPAAKILKVHGCTPLARQLQWQCQHAHVWSCNH